MKKSDIAITSLLKSKAKRSPCNYHVAAIAFDKKGDILGHVTNNRSSWDVIAKTGAGRAGTSKHAERLLLSRYSGNVKTILICRVGHSGALRPIDPCPTCKKVADKLGVKIVSLGEQRSK